MPEIITRSQIRRMAFDETRPGNRVIGLGDSVTAGSLNDDPATGGLLVGEFSPFTWLCTLSDNRARYLRNSGVPGDKAANVLARLDDDVFAHDPDTVVFNIGLNDVDTAEHELASRDTTAAIIDAILARRIDLLVWGVTPWGNGSGNSRTIPTRSRNLWLQDQCERRRVPFLDAYSIVMDPSTTGPFLKTAYRQNGIDLAHYSVAGAMVLGQAMVDAWIDRFPNTRPYLTYSKDGPVNMVANGTFQGDTDADGLATSWSKNSFTAVENEASQIDGAADGVIGNWQRVKVITPGSGWIAQQALSAKTVDDVTGWSVGDVLSMSCVLRTDLEAGGGVGYVYLTFTVNGIDYDMSPYYFISDDLAQHQPYIWRQIPVGTTAITVKIRHGNTGAGQVDVGQMTVLNHTRLGTEP